MPNPDTCAHATYRNSPTISDDSFGEFTTECRLRRVEGCNVLVVSVEGGTSWLKLGPSELYHIRIRPSATLHHPAYPLDLRELLLCSISVPIFTLATQRLVDNVVSQIKQLSDDLVCLAANCIVVHDIGREDLATLDLLSCLTGVVVVDVHL